MCDIYMWTFQNDEATTYINLLKDPLQACC